MASEEQHRTAAADTARVEAEHLSWRLYSRSWMGFWRGLSVQWWPYGRTGPATHCLTRTCRLTNQDCVRRVLDQIKTGLEPLVEFACRRTSGLDLPATADAMNLLMHIQAHPADYAAVLGVSHALSDDALSVHRQRLGHGHGQEQWVRGRVKGRGGGQGKKKGHGQG